MKLSEGVEWGLHCGVLLAALPPGTVLSGSALAEFHGVSESYLLKHLQALTRAGLLDSVQGPRGGFRLARPATDMTLLDVVEALEGRPAGFRCTEIRRRGPAALDDPRLYAMPCAINGAMLAAEAAWRDVLRARTIADLVGEVAVTVPAEALGRGAEWLCTRVRNP